MNTRIRLLRNSLNLTLNQFGSKIGLKGSSLCDIEKGNANITERTIISICSQFNVNEEWLRNGTGEMFNIENKNYKEFFSIYKNLNPVLQDFLITVAKDLLNRQDKL